ncbi:uncharacterized protein JCM6883_005252 [Sporobolomyces salmoneus]|uniref:uncharacterized protein n=1 Tax=Sporobolomyces salmoneus TaxID=183962 RepID=UPI0031813397
MDLPLEVKIIVYDLLPPSKFASLLNFCGTGVYHTSVSLTIPLGPTDTDPTPSEYAFGGHDSPGSSGIFSLPAGTTPQRMPGLRYYQTIDMGYAFGEEWEKIYGNSKRSTSSSENSRPRTLKKRSSKSSLLEISNRSEDASGVVGRPYQGYLDETSSTTLFGVGSEGYSAEVPEEDDGQSDGTGYMTKAQRRAWRIIQELKKDPQWDGTKYDLLKRNCNSFTEELVRRVTGKTAPYWINRAAFIATSFPCIVPAGMIDETEENVPTADASHGPTSVSIEDPTHLATNGGSIRIEPPRADRMDLGGRT